MSFTKPVAAHIREGTYRADRHEARAVITHSPLIEPDWHDLLPGDSTEAGRVRRDAALLWLRLAPALEASINISDAHREVLVDFAITQARLFEIDRQISQTSLNSVGQHGEPTRNHRFLIRGHLVNSLKVLRAELALSPKAAAALVQPVRDEDDEPLMNDGTPVFD